MDATLLLEYFSGTLQASQQVRQQAEIQLRLLAATPGFLGACLDIVASPAPAPVRLAAAVYLKNRIVRFWALDAAGTSAGASAGAIDPDERPVVKDRLLEVLVCSDHHTQQQLIPVLRVLIAHDFRQWPHLFDTALGLLAAANLNRVYVGLLCFTEICRRFRWVPNPDRASDLDPIISQVFPHLLALGRHLLEDHSEMSELRCEMLKLVLKAYKFVTYHDLPAVLQPPTVVEEWGQLHVAVVAQPPPPYMLRPPYAAMTAADRAGLQVAKCHKAALSNLLRLFARYASGGVAKRYKYTEFRRVFAAEVVPRVVRVLLVMAEGAPPPPGDTADAAAAAGRWLPRSTWYHALQFLSHCITQKTSWLLLKPYVAPLLTQLVFPLLCPSDELLELYDSDPLEYIQLAFDFSDGTTPDVAALGFLVTLVDKRRHTLDGVVQFALAELNRKAPPLRPLAQRTEGVLRIVGCILHYTLNPQLPYYSGMEQFLRELVLPHLALPFEFVRARALEVAGAFADLSLDAATEAHVFHAVTANFEVELLPLNLQCALCLQAYLPHAAFKDALGAHIVPLMGKLLALSEEVDTDAVAVVMQECVEVFSEQLQPFGVDLMTKLVQQFMRLAAEVGPGGGEFEADDADDSSEKIMAAIGLLNTMITVLLLFENLQPVLAQLEAVYLPAIEFVLTHQMDDFFTEVGELVENAIFLLRGISAAMWRVFGLVVRVFESGVGVMYTEEWMPALTNILIYGEMQSDAAAGFVRIFGAIVEGDDHVELSDLSDACELGQNLILALRQNATSYVPQILGQVLKILEGILNDTQHVRNNSFDVNVNNVIVAALVYAPRDALTVLAQHGFTQPFFERWSKLIPHLKRVYDIKLSAMGLMSVLSDDAVLSDLGGEFAAASAASLVHLVRILPAAIQSLEERRKNFSEIDDAGMQRLWEQEQAALDRYRTEEAGAEDEDEAGAEDGGEGDGADDGADGDDEYDLFLQQQEHDFKLKSTGFFDEETEQIHEDPLSATPLDTVNVFQYFKDFVVTVQAGDAHKSQALFGQLSEKDREVIQDVVAIVKE